MSHILTQEEWDKLKKSNSADQFALSVLDNLMLSRTLKIDFDNEILKLKDEHELPTGTLGIICGLMEGMIGIVNDLYESVYEAVDVEDMSKPVFDAFADARYAVRY